MGFFDRSRDHDYSQTFTRKDEYGARFRIKISEGLQRVEMSRDISKVVQSLLDSENRLVCIHSFISGSKVPVVETRSIQSGKECILNMLEGSKGICIASLFSIPRVLKKVQEEKAALLLITASWKTQAWYPRLLQMSITKPILLPRTENLLINPMREVHPLVINKTLSCSMGNFRRQLSAE